MTDEKKKIGSMLTEYPLYKSLSLPYNGNYLNMAAFNGITFDYECNACEGVKTFILKSLEGGSISSWNESYAFQDGDTINGKRCMSDFYKGLCQSCYNYNIDISLRVDVVNLPATDMRHVKPLNGFDKTTNEPSPQALGEITVMKIGQYPMFSIKPDKGVEKYLTKEDKKSYKSALSCLSRNQGMGALAYFRRIIENEIRRIIQDIADSSDGEAKAIYENHKNDKHLDVLIKAIYPYLPGSLKELGQNPIKILYSQLSLALHSLSEDECLEKSNIIKDLLLTVIEEIVNHRTKVQSMKDRIKLLG